MGTTELIWGGLVFGFGFWLSLIIIASAALLFFGCLAAWDRRGGEKENKSENVERAIQARFKIIRGRGADGK